MPVRTAVAYNLRAESFAAGKHAAQEACAGLGGEPPDCMMMFLTVGHDIAEVMRGVFSVTGEIPLVGSSGAGVITNMGCDEASHSVGLMAMKGEGVTFTPFLLTGLSNQSRSIGAQVAEQVEAAGPSADDTKLLVLLPDGITVDADGIYTGLGDELGYHIDVVGGTAGHDFQISETYQFCGKEVVSDGLSGVLIHGRFHYEIGVSHGSKPVGLFRTVTKAEGNYIYEIDGQSALTLLESFIGEERAKDFGQTLNMFELGESFADKDYSQDILNRAILGVDEERGGIRLAVAIPEGTKVRITHRDESLVLQRTREKAREVLGAMNDPEAASYLFFECSGRGSYLFGEPEPDVDALLEVTGREKPILGFYTFGELAPVAGRNYFHNYTAIFVGLE